MSTSGQINRSINPATGVTWADNDTIACECGMTVNVGKGGYGNLDRHKRYKPHKDAMAAKASHRVDRFFTKKEKLPVAAAPPPLLNTPSSSTSIDLMRDDSTQGNTPSALPTPSSSTSIDLTLDDFADVDSDAVPQQPTSAPSDPGLLMPSPSAAGSSTSVSAQAALQVPKPQSGLESVEAAFSSAPPWLTSFRRAVVSLPPDVPVFTEENLLAEFAYGPVIDLEDRTSTPLQQLYDFMDLWLPLDEPEESFLPLVARGKHGLDTVAEWLAVFLDQFEIGTDDQAPISERVERLTRVLLCLSHVEQTTTNLDGDAIPGQPARERLCRGFHVVLPPGISPFTSYPLAAHVAARLPWEPEFRRTGHLFLRSFSCAGLITSDVCRNCASLSNHPTLFTIFSRMVGGAKEGTDSHWLGNEQLKQRIDRLKDENNRLKLESVNTGRTLAVRAGQITLYKRFMKIVADGDIPRLGVAVRVALNNGSGIKGVLEVLMHATDKLYEAKSFSEREYRLVYVIYKYGGASSANIAHHALGLPTWRTALRHASIAMISISVGYPTIDETIVTIRSVFPKPLAQRIVGSVIMLDEVHTEPRTRYDAIDDSLKGLCRQHSDRFSLKFNSLDDVKAIFAGLDAGEVHLASEATVAAIGALVPGTREHTARPIHISGSCKREDATDHARLISTLVDACAATKEIHGTRPYCIASDGESKRGKALTLLTLKHPLPTTSPIYDALSSLPLFNTACGDDDITADKDYKHIFKRLRGLLLREAGVNVFGVYITRDIVRRHLIACGMSPERADSLLNPNDLQDVVLAVTLLAKVMQMQPLTDSDPSLTRAREALRFLGHLFGSIIRPFTTVAYSLREQLNSLSTAAHLLFSLYTHGRGSAMPVQLYTDIMIMIKNVFFCVAKAQVDDPDGTFFIILLGTDRLEIVFGKMRCMIGSDCNADMLQLRERITAAAECAFILASTPEWDEQPRRLRVPSLDEHGELLLDSAIDHINPQSWTGDVSVSGISLRTAWTIGRQRATQIVGNYISFDFLSHSLRPNVDILQPFGKLAIRDGLAEGEVDEVEAACISPLPQPATAPSPVSIQAGDGGDLDPDLEDVSSAALAEQTTSHRPWLDIDGKRVYKASVIRLFSSPGFRAGPDSTDRLKRVRNYKRFDSASDTSSWELPDDPGSRYLQVNDPAATLLRCEDRTFLAVVQVASIKVDGASRLALRQDQISASTVSVRCQILTLTARVPNPDDDHDIFDWETDSSPIGELLELSGRMLECINPVTMPRDDGTKRTVIFCLTTQDLLAITVLLHERLIRLATISLPSVERTGSWPYQYNGRACFVCAEEEGQSLGLIKNGCELCGSSHPAFASPQRQLSHMAAHILFDPTLEGIDGTCGFCLQPNSLCMWYVTKSVNPSVIMRDSMCPKKPTRFLYKAAARSTKSSPSSNVPVCCPLCPPRAPAIWRYSLRRHLELAHPDCDPDQHRALWRISSAEKYALETVWDKIKTTIRRPRQKTSRPALLISEAHTSRILMRTTGLADGSAALGTNNEPQAAPAVETAEDETLSDSESLNISDAGSIEDADERTQSDITLEITRATSVNVAPQREASTDVAERNRDANEIVPAVAQVTGLTPRGQSAPEPSIASSSSDPHPRTSGSATGAKAQPRPAVPSDTAPAASTTSAVRVSTRKRNAASLVVIQTCSCAKGPILKSGEFPSREDDMIECTYKGCESRYYHRRCVDIEPGETVPRWVCEHCRKGVSDEPGTGNARASKRRRKDPAK